MKKHIGKILAALVVVYLLVNMAAVITYPNQYKVIKTMGPPRFILLIRKRWKLMPISFGG